MLLTTQVRQRRPNVFSETQCLHRKEEKLRTKNQRWERRRVKVAEAEAEEERRKREHEEEQQAKRYRKNEQRKMRDRERATIKKQLANAHIAQAGIVEDAAEPEPIAEEGPHCVRDVTGQFVPGTVDGEAAAAVDAAPSAAAVAEAEEPTQVAATDAAVAGQQQAEVSEPVTMVRITPGCQANPILQILMC